MTANKRQTVDNDQQLQELAHKLGFNNDDLDMLRCAITHSTFFEGKKKQDKDDDNQRLEFLGDAVLSLVVGEALFNRYPAAREGEMSKMRAFLVCEASLAELAQRIDLQKALRMGKGAEVGGDRYRPSVQADAYEALIGAIFVCQGYAQAKEFLLQQFADRLDKLSPEDYEDKKSLLQEVVQERVPHGVIYKILGQSGPDHQPQFESAVYCGKLLLGQGIGKSKKESELAAAADALSKKSNWLDIIE